MRHLRWLCVVLLLAAPQAIAQQKGVAKGMQAKTIPFSGGEGGGGWANELAMGWDGPVGAGVNGIRVNARGFKPKPLTTGLDSKGHPIPDAQIDWNEPRVAGTTWTNRGSTIVQWANTAVNTPKISWATWWQNKASTPPDGLKVEKVPDDKLALQVGVQENGDGTATVSIYWPFAYALWPEGQGWKWGIQAVYIDNLTDPTPTTMRMEVLYTNEPDEGGFSDEGHWHNCSYDGVDWTEPLFPGWNTVAVVAWPHETGFVSIGAIVYDWWDMEGTWMDHFNIFYPEYVPPADGGGGGGGGGGPTIVSTSSEILSDVDNGDGTHTVTTRTYREWSDDTEDYVDSEETISYDQPPDPYVTGTEQVDNGDGTYTVVSHWSDGTDTYDGPYPYDPPPDDPPPECPPPC